MKKRTSLICSAAWFAASACEFALLAAGTAKKTLSTLHTVLTAADAGLALTLGTLYLCDYLTREPDEEPEADTAGEVPEEGQGTPETAAE